VEGRALNLTSKLLMKEMEMGMIKKEKIRLEQQIPTETQIPNELNIIPAPNELNSIPANKDSSDVTHRRRKLPNKGMLPVLREGMIHSPAATEQVNVDKEAQEIASNSTLDDSDQVEKEGLVDKLMDIKKKQHELDEAKKEFFSDTVSDAAKPDRENSEQKNTNKPLLHADDNNKEIVSQLVEIKKDLNKHTHLPTDEAIQGNVNGPTKIDETVKAIKLNVDMPAPENVDQEEIKQLIKLPDGNKDTATAATPRGNVTTEVPNKIEKKIHIILNDNKTATASPHPVNNLTTQMPAIKEDDEKKIHIILDVNNQNPTEITA
jgi:hypothetical protein